MEILILFVKLELNLEHLLFILLIDLSCNLVSAVMCYRYSQISLRYLSPASFPFLPNPSSTYNDRKAAAPTFSVRTTRKKIRWKTASSRLPYCPTLSSSPPYHTRWQPCLF